MARKYRLLVDEKGRKLPAPRKPRPEGTLRTLLIVGALITGIVFTWSN